MAKTPVVQAAPDPYQANMFARQQVLQRSIDMTQQIFATTLAGNPRGQVINVPLRNVGLIKKIIVETSFTLIQAAAETLTRTAWGPANIYSNITLTDLSNQTRVNTTGWHLHMLATARRQMAYAAAFTNDSPVAVASNFAVEVAPTPITTIQTIRHFMEIPLAYGDFDLRGALYANVVNATMNLQLTVNNLFVAATGTNPTLAGYLSSSADLGTMASFTIKVYQNYLDQLPFTKSGPILPLMDLATAYTLNNTVVTGLAANQDIAIPFSNFRDFLSMGVIYDNFGSATALGASINTWSLQSANYTNIFQFDPWMQLLQTRNIINDDMPAAIARECFYFDFRRKPIQTIQYGNMQIVGNPAQVQASTSQLLVGLEALALINQVTQAGSLYNT